MSRPMIAALTALSLSVALGRVSHARDLIAVRPGLMCEAAEALAKLTMPDGSSRAARPDVTLADLAVKRRGGCIDIALGMRVTVLESRVRTSIVRYQDAAGPHTFIVPNVDFGPAQDAGQATAEVPSTPPAPASPPQAEAYSPPPEPQPQTQAAIAPPGAPAAPTAPAPVVPPAEPPSSASPAAIPPAAVAVPATSRTQDVFRSPPIDPVTVAFAYAKLTNATPDIDSFAEQSAAYKMASAFDRSRVLEHEKQRLAKAFAELRPDQLYHLRLSSALMPYDSTAVGFRLNWSDASSIGFQDPTRPVSYAVQLENASDFTLVPMQNEDAARQFAHTFNLWTATLSSTGVVYDIVFRLTTAPPPQTTGVLPLSASIVAARILTMAGQIMYVFPAATEAPRASDAQPPRSLDIQGIHVGMSYAGAVESLGGKFSFASDPRSKAVGVYLNGFQKDHGWLACGSIHVFPGYNDAQAYETWESTVRLTQRPTEAMDDFSDCVGVQAAGPRFDQVYEVTSQQFLATPLAQVSKALAARYGKPAQSGFYDGQLSDFVWIGPDNSSSSGMVKLTATFRSLGTGRNILSLDLIPYVDPNKKPDLPQALTGPKL